MRLKTYHATTMSEAMQMVRDQLGADAIIVATHADEGSSDVRITAAVEQEDAELDFQADSDNLDIVDRLSGALDDHGTPMALVDRLLGAVANLNIDDETLALAGALDACFTFSPLPEARGARPLMFVGPPGSGKTVGVAKLAVRTRLAGNDAAFITTDTLRAGAVEQLSAYGSRLGLETITAATPAALADAIANIDSEVQILIDSAGVNPTDPGDMERLKALCEACSVETVIVMAAGGDPLESAELCAAFYAVNPTRLVMTRLDMVRRLGGMLAAAEAGALPFGDVSMTPDIASGLQGINPVSLARLLLSGTAQEPARMSEIFKATGSE